MIGTFDSDPRRCPALNYSLRSPLGDIFVLLTRPDPVLWETIISQEGLNTGKFKLASLGPIMQLTDLSG